MANPATGTVQYQSTPVAQTIDESQVSLTVGATNAVAVQHARRAQEVADRDYAMEVFRSENANSKNVPFAERIKRKASAASILESDDYKPIFTYTIVAVNGVVLGVELLMNYLWEGVVFVSFDQNPMIGPSGQTLIAMGAKVTDLIIEDEEWWRLIAPVVLHAGVIHLVLNMLFVLWFGGPLERAFGFCRVASIYIISGISGNLLSALFLPNVATVGASGACYGLIGATWADFFLNCSYYRGIVIRTLVALGLGTILNLAIGLLPMLDNFAHIGGLITGFCVGMSVMSRKRYNSQREEKPELLYQIFCSVTCSLVTPLLIIFMTVLLYSDSSFVENCSWCDYLSCVPTPWWSCDPTCDNQYRFETISTGTDSGAILLTCPGDLGTRLLQPPFPLLETSQQQIAVCEQYCGSV